MQLIELVAPAWYSGDAFQLMAASDTNIHPIIKSMFSSLCFFVFFL
jgi:hypothetical protein